MTSYLPLLTSTKRGLRLGRLIEEPSFLAAYWVSQQLRLHVYLKFCSDLDCIVNRIFSESYTFVRSIGGVVVR